MPKSLIILAGIAGTVLVVFIIFLAISWERIVNKFTPDNPWPTLNSPASIDPVVLGELENAVNYSKEIWSKAYGLYDISDFPQVFVDDPTVPLSRDQLKYLNEVKANQAGLTDVLKGQGWLTYSRSLILNLESGRQAYQLQATLSAQGKTMGPDDYRKVGAPAPPPGVTPTTFPSISNQLNPPGYRWKVSFLTVKVEGSRAQVEYSNTDRWETDFLVKTAKGWRIAGARFD